MYPFVGLFCSFLIMPHESSYFLEQALYIKTKIRTYGEKFRKVYIHFRGLNVLEGSMECASFTVISIDFLLIFENKYLQVYLGNCANKIVNTQMVDYFGDNLFDSDKN